MKKPTGSLLLVSMWVLVVCSIAGAQVRRQTQVPPFQELLRMFDYDPSAPLDIQESGVRDIDGVKVHDITYASPKGGLVPAYLVVPAGKGSFAGIVYQHYGLGNRSEFLPEALLLAKAGAVCLLIDAPSIRPAPWTRSGDFTHPEAERDGDIQNVIDLRRGVDLLTARADVDPKRIGYVGHSYGADLGGVLAGVEKRIKAYVLMAGSATSTEDLFATQHPLVAEAVESTPKDQMEKYVKIMAPLDAIHYVGRAASIALFFQFARYDMWIPETAALEYYRAASEPKLSKWYDTGHELNDLAALRDRAEWLQSQLGLEPVLPLLRTDLIPEGTLHKRIAYQSGTKY